MFRLAKVTLCLLAAYAALLACTVASLPPVAPVAPVAPGATGTPAANPAPAVLVRQFSPTRTPYTPHPTAIPPDPSCEVTAQVLHLRACAGVDCEVIGWLYSGELLTVTAGAAWLQVITPGGAAGWVNGEFCEVTK